MQRLQTKCSGRSGGLADLAGRVAQAHRVEFGTVKKSIDNSIRDGGSSVEKKVHRFETEHIPLKKT